MHDRQVTTDHALDTAAGEAGIQDDPAGHTEQRRSVSMPPEPEYDPDWDSPEAIAKWRVRGIRDIRQRAKEFHRIKADLEMEIGLERAPSAPKSLMQEEEIEAAIQRNYDALRERRAKDNS